MEVQIDTERVEERTKENGMRWKMKNLLKLCLIQDLNSNQIMVFKPGFFNAVENKLAVSLPNSGIKAKPHIESQIKTKNDWVAVHDMLNWNNTSGFGWDYANNMIEAPQAVWQAYVQVHRNAGKWRGKKFPHYWDLRIMFGKDRTNARDAQTATDVVYEMDKEQVRVDNQQGNDGLEDSESDHETNTRTSLRAPSREGSTTHQKRKRSNNWDPLINSLKESADIIGSKFEEATKSFTSVLGIEKDREELRKKLHTKMKKVEGLTPPECNKAVCMLSRNEDLMVIFFTVEDEDKLTWVLDLLA